MRIMALSHTFVRGSDEESERRRLERLYRYASPGTTIEIHYPEDLGGSEVLRHQRTTKTLAGLHHVLETPALVKKIIEAERDGFDAVVQTDAFDPGVEAARLAVRIPVVGSLRASCHFAATLCERFALTVPLESYVPYVWRLVETYRMEHFVSGIKVIGMYEVGDLSKYHDAILARTIEVARELVSGGAQALIPLAARLIPAAVAPEEVEREIGVPVINTQAVAIRFAELMVSSKTSHSQRAYPWAPGLTPDHIVKRGS
ncbi:MAG TPA: aspartate/glutamate racemase family protein [Candidatus Acidoferrales bacterium]|nr:aspartate/glutamate racemase family protein [Candidatus Acidoferrales bacterium]